MAGDRKAEVVAINPVDDEHQVVTVKGGDGLYRRSPCEPTDGSAGCPWRVDQTGRFPAGAFRVSARTAYDQSSRTFGCHQSIRQSTDIPLICAGFLLRGAEHNLRIRMKLAAGEIDLDRVHDGGHPLHAGYITMAVANGVDPDDPVLHTCRWSSYEIQED